MGAVDAAIGAAPVVATPVVAFLGISVAAAAGVVLVVLLLLLLLLLHVLLLPRPPPVNGPGHVSSFEWGGIH